VPFKEFQNPSLVLQECPSNSQRSTGLLECDGATRDTLSCAVDDALKHKSISGAYIMSYGRTHKTARSQLVPFEEMHSLSHPSQRHDFNNRCGRWVIQLFVAESEGEIPVSSARFFYGPS
jgi:hypothetical protein